MVKKVREVMTRDPVTVGADSPVRRAFELSREQGLRRLPVMEGDMLAGIITDRDLRVLQTISGAASFAERYRDFLLQTMSVREAMTPDPHTISPDADLAEAARRMVELGVGGLPVVEGDRLVGILTATDLIRLFIDVLEGRGT